MSLLLKQQLIELLNNCQLDETQRNAVNDAIGKDDVKIIEHAIKQCAPIKNTAYILVKYYDRIGM